MKNYQALADDSRPRPNADYNLLVGILALQMDFVDRDQLIGAMNAWVLDKLKPLEEVFADQGALNEEEKELLTALVRKHLEKHGNKAEESLASVTSVPSSIREELRGLGDADVELTLTHVVSQRPDEPAAVTTMSVGESTSRDERFIILRPHAKGGLGEVSVAKDLELNREVALKEIQERFADDADSRSRFLLEAEVTGGLEHPGIVPVYGLGQYADGRPFYAMRFIRGDSFKEAADRFHSQHARPAEDGTTEGTTTSAGKVHPTFDSVEFRRLLGRFVDVCNAIEYAHSRGVLHRDLKPGNVMLGKYGETLVVDWGLAKAVGQRDNVKHEGETTLRPSSGSGSAPTQMGSAIGTPAFMSPEQAAGRLDELGPASDVYSLGATLYYLLVGKPPVVGKDLGAVLRKVQAGEFHTPRSIDHNIPKDLEAVCLKAMATRIEGRYGSPSELADDVEKWLADDPVSAREGTLVERAGRFARRHRSWTLAGTTALGLIAIVLTVAVVFVNGARRNERQQRSVAEELLGQKERLIGEKDSLLDANAELIAQKNDALRAHQEERDRAEWQIYITQLQSAQSEWEQGKGHTAVAYLDACRWDYRGLEFDLLSTLFRAGQQNIFGLRDVRDLAISPDGQQVVTGSVSYAPFFEKAAVIWDMRTGRELSGLRTLEGLEGSRHIVGGVDFRSDGKRIATCAGQHIDVWDADTGQKLLRINGPHNFTDLSYSPDGTRLVSGESRKTIRLWDANSGKEIKAFEGDFYGRGGIRSITFSPDGTKILGGSTDHTIRLWEVPSGRELARFEAHSEDISAIDFSPDGQYFVSGSSDGTARIWDSATGAKLATVEAGTDVYDVAFSPDGKHIAVSTFTTIRICDSTTGSVVQTLKPLFKGGHRAAFTPDGTHLVSGNDFGFSIFDLRRAQRPRSLSGHDGSVSSVVFSSDGRQIVSAASDRTVKVWDADTEELLLELKGHSRSVNCVAINKDGTRIASGSEDRTVRLWDAHTGEQLLTLRLGASATSVAFTPDGERIVIGKYYESYQSISSSALEIWNVNTGRLATSVQGETAKLRCAAVSPNGRQILTGSEAPYEVKVWDAETEQELFRLPGFFVNDAAFSPDGKYIATVGNAVRIWDSATGDELHTLVGDGFSRATSVTFSNDADRIIAVFFDGRLRIWNAQNGQELLEMDGHRGAATAIAFSPTDSRFVTGGDDGSLKIWETSIPPTTRVLMGQVTDMSFTRDGSRLRGVCGDNTLRTWDLASGKQLSSIKVKERLGWSRFSPDGTRIVTSRRSDDGTLRCRIMDTNTGMEQLAFDCGANDSGAKSLRMIIWSPDGNRIACPIGDGAVRVWDASNGKEVASLQDESLRINFISFSPDSTRLVASGTKMSDDEKPEEDRRGGIVVWDVNGRKESVKIECESIVGPVAYCPRGECFAGVAFDKAEMRTKVVIWESTTGKKRNELVDSRSSLGRVVYSPDGRWVITTPSQDSITVWDAQSFEKIATLWPITDGMLNCVRVSNDGAWIAAACGDGKICLWNTASIEDRQSEFGGTELIVPGANTD